MTLERRIRKIERILGPGCELLLLTGTRDGKPIPIALSVLDHETGGFRHTVKLGPPSKYERQVDAVHNAVYRERGKAKYVEQKGLCAMCGSMLNGCGETDHIVRRSKGRDDRMSNLRICHAECHRKRHEGKGF